MKSTTLAVRLLTLCFVLSLGQALSAQTGLVLINRTMGPASEPKQLRGRDDFISHTFVAFVENGTVRAVVGWGEGEEALASVLAGNWYPGSIADWSVAQLAIDTGHYTMAVSGGDLNQFYLAFSEVSSGWSHPNLGFLFNCKWAAWNMANNFSINLYGTWQGVANVQPIPTWADDWIQAHLHPGYWAALQMSVNNPYAMSQYNNVVAAEAQRKNPQSGMYVEN